MAKKQNLIEATLRVVTGVCECWTIPTNKTPKRRMSEWEDAIPANAAVLCKSGTMWKEGEKYNIVKFIAIEGARSPKPKDIVMPLLALLVAEAKYNAGYDAEFKIVKYEGRDVDTGIRSRKSFSAWLSATEILKSNNEGECSKALEVLDGIKLSATALNIKKSDKELLGAKGELLRILMNQRALAICKQVKMRADIIKSAVEIHANSYNTKTEVSAETEEPTEAAEVA